jgi:serine/threonine-protein kinase
LNVTPGEWQQLFSLLDTAFELPLSQRAAWLADLELPSATLKDTLGRLLSQHAILETADFLASPVSLRVFQEPTDHRHAVDVGSNVGPYRLIAEIGVGGMGSVWLAERVDGQLTRQVAVKLPHAGPFERQLVARFAQERDILAGLEHPHIARLYDAGIAATGQPYLALEYVEGVPITDFCDRERLQIRERLLLFQQVLDAVQYAHSQLIVHRDIKPSNILITTSRQAVLLDFGIAKLVTGGEVRESELTQLGVRALTPDYAAPEQIARGAITIAADVYSLGVVLYELVTGCRPYSVTRVSPAALEEAILAGDARVPSHAAIDDAGATNRGTTIRRLARALKGDLDTIILKALKKLPNERYPTSDAFRQDVDRFLRGLPVQARPDTLWYRSRKFVERNRLAVGAAAAVTISLVAGFGIAVWQARAANREAQIAENQARTAEGVQGFIEEMLAANTADQPNPELARQTTARELLDRGSRKIATSLNDAPVAKLRVLKTLSRMYRGLDLENEATGLARERVSLARSVYGYMDVRLADALIDLAATANGGFQIAEAGAALKEAEAILDHERDDASPMRGRADVQLAFYNSAQTNYANTLLYAERAVAVLRPHGPSKDLAQALWVQANSKINSGRPGDGLVAATEALAIAKSLNGQINSLLPGIYLDLGYAQTELADFAGAEASFRDSVTAAQAIYGSNASTTLETQRMLGDLLWMTSRVHDSLDVLSSARGVALTLAANGNSSTIPELTLLKEARALTLYGRFEDAPADIRAAEQIRAKLLPVAWLNARVLETDAEYLTETGAYPDAEARLERAAEIEAGLGWDESSQYNVNVILRTRLLMAEGRGAEATKVFAGYKTADDPSRPNFLAVLEQKVTNAELALLRNDAQESATQAAWVHAHDLPSDKRMYLEIYETRALLVDGKSHLLRAEAREALPLLQRAVVLGTKVYDPTTSPRLADAEVALASCYVTLGNLAAARQLMVDATAIHATHKHLGEHYRKPLRLLIARFNNAREGSR